MKTQPMQRGCISCGRITLLATLHKITGNHARQSSDFRTIRCDIFEISRLAALVGDANVAGSVALRRRDTPFDSERLHFNEVFLSPFGDAIDGQCHAAVAYSIGISGYGRFFSCQARVLRIFERAVAVVSGSVSLPIGVVLLISKFSPEAVLVFCAVVTEML